MIVSVRAFTEVGGYHEDLPFYYSDPFFIYKFKKKHEKIFLLDAQLEHDSFFISQTDYKLVLERYKGMLKTSLTYGKLIKSPLQFIFFYTIGLKLSWRFRTTSFIKSMIEETYNTIVK